MILELDLGNTCAKWRIASGSGAAVARGVADIADWFAGRFPESWYLGVERVRIASVLAQTTENDLIEKIKAEYSVPVQIARATSNCCGVTNAYMNCERLGVDRWLAVIAAYKLSGGAAMIVDVGTALKIDAVDDAGHHLGGYILPGPKLMEGSLLQDTDRVRFESDQPIQSVALGRDTRSCVQHGIAAALVGAVMVAVQQFKIVIGWQPHIYLTGGFGELLKEHLSEAGVSDIRFEADLVLDGLRWVLP